MVMSVYSFTFQIYITVETFTVENYLAFQEFIVTAVPWLADAVNQVVIFLAENGRRNLEFI